MKENIQEKVTIIVLLSTLMYNYGRPTHDLDKEDELNSLQWRHSGHDSVSNYQPHDCLLNHLFRRRSKITSKLRVTGLCAGNSPGPVNSPHKGPVTRKMFPFDDVIMWIIQWLFCPSQCTGATLLITWLRFIYNAYPSHLRERAGQYSQYPNWFNHRSHARQYLLNKINSRLQFKAYFDWNWKIWTIS